MKVDNFFKNELTAANAGTEVNVVVTTEYTDCSTDHCK